MASGGLCARDGISGRALVDDVVVCADGNDREVRKLERGDRLQSQRERLVSSFTGASASQISADAAQRAKNLGPVEALAVAMFTEVCHSIPLRAVSVAKGDIANQTTHLF